MPVNSLENAKRYSDELDKMFAQKSATGFFADNARHGLFPRRYHGKQHFVHNGYGPRPLASD